MKIQSTIPQMQREVYENGPISTTLLIYEDLFNYGGGIYVHTAGDVVAGHAMRIVGWGHEEDGHLFWICQNQWTTDWGEDGYIRIRAGEANIDTWGVSCEPDLDFVFAAG